MNLLLPIAATDESAIFYIIAVLVLSVGGAIFNKLKEKMQGEPPARPTPPTVAPPRPTLPRPVPPRASPPLPRPVIREDALPRAPLPRPIPPRPAAPPVRPAPARPAATPPRPVPRPAPPRPAMPKPVDVRRPAPPAARPPLAPAAPGRLAPPLMVDVIAPEEAKRPQQALTEAVTRSRLATQLEHTPTKSELPAAQQATGLRKPTRDELRRAVILSEILGPPLALREN